MKKYTYPPKPLTYILALILPLTLFALLLAAACSPAPQNHWEMTSPDRQVAVAVSLSETGTLSYSLTHSGRKVLGESPLGMVFEESAFDAGLTLKSVARLRNQNDHYTMLTGKRKENHAHWNELQLHFTNTDAKPVNLNFRVFNTGLAFNYSFESSSDQTYTLEEELTGFQLPADGYGWMHPYDTVWQWAPSYETHFEHKVPVGTPSPWNKNGWAFPMLFFTGDDWVLISDADMPEGYVGMIVDGNPQGGLYTLNLPPEEEAMGICPSQPTLTLPFRTPWRLAITGDNPGVILESNMVFDVSTPNVLGDVSWIKPGRSAWSWWSESDSPRDYHRMKEFIDFTSEMGWEYFLVDANWNEMEGGNLEQLTRYANSIGVNITNWYNSGGPHNVITEAPRDLMHTRVARRAEFETISQWGIKGVKVDFFQSDKYCIMQQYHDILRDAADFEILVNVHGSTISRGWERTYPNLMTMEAVRGAEVYKFGADFPEVAPRHNTILPFTRNVLGSMDYTPVTFSNSTYPKKTTHAHELALAVVFESGLQHFADSDMSYMSQPEYVIDYLKEVPVVWDDTRYVAGFPGEMAVLARRSGDTWYLSGISGLEEAVAAVFNLNFLESGSYTMELIGDGNSQDEFRYKERDVTAGQQFSIDMLPRGGFAGVIRRR
ncbi:MAG: glycoside hydrolase family 97 protein [Bacteroidetes bacterium]|nr:MAG: glycoside hydrolase family 97 protein [Bacteroidota bacterium]